MGILFVINCFAYGGAEKLVYDLSQALASGGTRISVAGLYRMDNETEARMRKKLEDAGIKTYILDKRAGKDRLRSVMKLRAICRADRIRVIHGHCSVPMLLSKLAGCFTGVKVVCTVHNTRGYHARMEQLTAWMVHRYVSIGQAAEEYMLRELGLKEEKIVRIYNSVDTGRFHPGCKTPGFWEKFGLDGDVPVILHVGRVSPAKNQLCLLRALDRCAEGGSPVQCVILGAYEEESPTYRELAGFIRDKGMENRVRFLGQQENVQDFLHNCDCFVMTSWYEGLSVAYLEAVLCGVPVVVTDLPFVRELEPLGPSAVIVAQDDHEALARILKNREFTPPSGETMEAFRERFSMERFADSHLKLYQAVIGQ